MRLTGVARACAVEGDERVQGRKLACWNCWHAVRMPSTSVRFCVMAANDAAAARLKRTTCSNRRKRRGREPLAAARGSRPEPFSTAVWDDSHSDQMTAHQCMILRLQTRATHS
eukprot:6190321-Pleurochrysis_carterae.AAC.1